MLTGSDAKDQQYRLDVLDAQGRLLYTAENILDGHVLPTADMPAGTWILAVLTDVQTGHTWNGKVWITR